MKGKYKRDASMVCDGRYFSSVSTTIKRRRTDTLTTKNIFNKRGVDNTSRRTRSNLKINTNKIKISVLKKMVLRPERKIMVNGFPRTSGDRKTRPLTTRTKNV